MFLSTKRLEEIVEFYTSRLGMKVWLEQEDCTILQYDDLTIGFCLRNRANTGGTITFWYDTKEEVDAMYARLKDIAESPPRENPKYGIYHFFFRDPEGRTLEGQKFLNLRPV